MYQWEIDRAEAFKEAVYLLKVHFAGGPEFFPYSRPTYFKPAKTAIERQEVRARVAKRQTNTYNPK